VDLVLARLGLGRRPEQRLDVAQRQLVLADHLEQRLGAAKAELRRQVLELERRLALALQHLLHRLAAARHGRVGGEALNQERTLALERGLFR
jgi:hypothetical protein